MTDISGAGTAPAAIEREDRTVAGAIYGLYLFTGLMFGLPMLVGLILAYSKLGTAGPKLRSHYIFQVRTVWTGLAWVLIGTGLLFVGFILSVVLIGIPLVHLGFLILSLTYVWIVARCVAGGIYLSQDAPYPRPRSWLI